MRLFIDMDGVVAKWGTITSQNDLYSEGYFLNCIPEDTLIEEIKLLIKSGIKVYPTTHFLDSKYAYNEKRMWLKKHISAIPESNYILVPYGRDKAEFINRLSNFEKINSNDILLDDHSPNLFSWERAGGTGIKFMNGINGNNGTWKGRKIGKSCDFPNSLSFHINTILYDYCPPSKYKEFYPFIALGRESNIIFDNLSNQELIKLNKKILIYETGSASENEQIAKNDISILWYNGILSAELLIRNLKDLENNNASVI